MINLLPPELKKQYYFARLNTGIRKYVFMSAIIGFLLSAVLLLGNLFATMFVEDTELRLAEQSERIAQYSEVEEKATQINSQITKLAGVLNKTTRYSNVIEDIARNLPRGSRILGINLDGDIGQPLQLTVVADSESTALRVQPTLENMNRFSFVDIEEFRRQDNTYQVDLALTFADAEAALR